MLSTRSIYNADLGAYRRSERGLATALKQGHMVSDDHDGSSTDLRSISTHDQDSKAPTSQRKRVPVACERCRKRKIKCSGDEGGGRGCINCRNAGWDGCQFLRVQSFNAPVNTSTVSSGRSWPINRYHPYAYGSQRQVVPSLAAQTASHTSPLGYNMWQQSSVDYANYPNHSQGLSWTRVPYPAGYSLDYENEHTSPYSNPPPSYMQPDPDPGPHMTVNYMNSFARPQHGSAWLDHMAGTTITHSMTQSSTPTYNLHTIEPAPTYSGIGSGTNDVGRTLPDPVLARGLPTASIASSDTPPLSALSHLSSSGWLPETASSASIASSRTSCSGRQNSAGSYANPNCTVQDDAYGYAATTSSSQTMTPVSSLLEGTESIQQQSPVLRPGISLLPRHRWRPSSRDNLRSIPDNVSLMYGYNSSSLQGRRSNAEETSQSLASSETYWPPTQFHLKGATDQGRDRASSESQPGPAQSHVANVSAHQSY